MLPIRNVSPSIEAPSATISFSRPSAVCVQPTIVIGPLRTLNSTLSPAPRLPWKSLRARSVGCSSAIAMWPGPSWPIRMKSSSKSSA